MGSEKMPSPSWLSVLASRPAGAARQHVSSMPSMGRYRLRCSENKGKAKAGRGALREMNIGLEVRGAIIFFYNHNIAPYFTVYNNVSKGYRRRPLSALRQGA